MSKRLNQALEILESGLRPLKLWFNMHVIVREMGEAHSNVFQVSIVIEFFDTETWLSTLPSRKKRFAIRQAFAEAENHIRDTGYNQGSIQFASSYFELCVSDRKSPDQPGRLLYRGRMEFDLHDGKPELPFFLPVGTFPAMSYLGQCSTFSTTGFKAE